MCLDLTLILILISLVYIKVYHLNNSNYPISECYKQQKPVYMYPEVLLEMPIRDENYF